MEQETRILRTPSESNPLLEAFVRQIVPKLGDKRRDETLRSYLNGLLTDHPNKNCDTLAQIVPESSEQRLQSLLTTMQWDEQAVNARRIKVMQGLATEGDGVLVFDGTDFPKKGKHSVGVAAQYSGSQGKVANCQVTVNCHYAERTIGWPVGTRLYLPKVWAEDSVRRAEVYVPEAITFNTKAEIAVELLDQANGLAIRHRCVTADAEFGDDPGFLDALEQRRETYVVDVRKDFRVSLSRGASGLVQRAEAVIAALPKRAWHVLRWRQGYEGTWLKGSFAPVRCWRVDGQGRRRMGWLIAQRELPDGSGRTKFLWSNGSASTPLMRMVEWAHRRYAVELFHQDAKTLLGWDQYQGRLWQGFHRNAVLVMLSYSFLVWLEWQHRQTIKLRGRPRGALSPSQGSPTHFPAFYSSPHR